MPIVQLEELAQTGDGHCRKVNSKLLSLNRDILGCTNSILATCRPICWNYSAPVWPRLPRWLLGAGFPQSLKVKDSHRLGKVMKFYVCNFHVWIVLENHLDPWKPWKSPESLIMKSWNFVQLLQLARFILHSAHATKMLDVSNVCRFPSQNAGMAVHSCSEIAATYWVYWQIQSLMVNIVSRSYWKLWTVATGEHAWCMFWHIGQASVERGFFSTNKQCETESQYN